MRSIPCSTPRVSLKKGRRMQPRLVTLILKGFLILTLLCPLIACKGEQGGKSGELIVAVAASMVPLTEDIAKDFERTHACTVKIVSGASQALARQAKEGAPYDLLVAADSITIDGLAKDGLLTEGTRIVYARGSLDMWISPKAAGMDGGMADVLATAIKGSARIAIANPETAPYGTAAKKALEAIGAYDKLKDRIVLGGNVGEVFQFAKAGEVDIAFLPHTLRMTVGRTLPVPEEMHDPLDHALGVLKASKQQDLARAFATEFVTPATQRAFAQAGLTPLGK